MRNLIGRISAFLDSWTSVGVSMLVVGVGGFLANYYTGFGLDATFAMFGDPRISTFDASVFMAGLYVTGWFLFLVFASAIQAIVESYQQDARHRR